MPCSLDGYHVLAVNRLTTDQGRQFKSHLFHDLAKLCDVHLCRTNPHHPAANGLVQRLHRKLQATILCHADKQWIEALPLVLDIRTAYKEDLQSSAELNYGEPLRVPGELLVPAALMVKASTFIHLRHQMDLLRPTPKARQSSPGYIRSQSSP